jgi:hypothetical protein
LLKGRIIHQHVAAVDDLAKDNDLNVYLTCADAMRKFDKDGNLLSLEDTDRTGFGQQSSVLKRFP